MKTLTPSNIAPAFQDWWARHDSINSKSWRKQLDAARALLDPLGILLLEEPDGYFRFYVASEAKEAPRSRKDINGLRYTFHINPRDRVLRLSLKHRNHAFRLPWFKKKKLPSLIAATNYAIEIVERHERESANHVPRTTITT